MKKLITNRIFKEDYLKEILSILSEWTYKIDNNLNFSFIKFGDGELLSMMGPEKRDSYFGVSNCDYHPFDKDDLGKKLIDAWNFLNDYNNKYNNIYIAEWTQKPFGGSDSHITHKFLRELMSIENFNIKMVNFEIMLQNTLSEEKFNFFKSIKESKRKKIFVGPDRLHAGVTKFLDIDTCVSVPMIQKIRRNNQDVVIGIPVIDMYDEILLNIENNIEKDAILLFSCSMPAKSFIHKSLEFENEITCLDIGSGFDSIFIGHTREGQFSPNIIKKYYEELL